jgi:SAM-dependent methyltransferase
MPFVPSDRPDTMSAPMTDTSSRPPEPTFRSGLFEGTAEDYDRYRLPYPHALIERIRTDLRPDGTGRLVDLGAGTGQVARGLRQFFADVIAVDPEPDMVEYGRARSAREGDAIEWRLGRAEDVDFPSGSLDVVASGNAFHRFDRPVVAKKAADWLRPDGAILVMWSNAFTDPAWTEGGLLQAEISRVLEEWHKRSGADARVPVGWERKEYPDDVVLREAGFRRLVDHEVRLRHTWTVDTIIGFLRATSASSRAALGDFHDAFEADLRKTLLDVDRSGRYEQEVRYGALIARR